MTTSASETEETRAPFLAMGQFLLLPFLGFLGAAWVTGFPWVHPRYYLETRALQYSAILAALCSGCIVAVTFTPTTALKRNDLIKHLVIVALALLGGHVLWVEPIWGFHHDSSLGIFAWLFIGGEDGFEIMPNVCGLPLTIISYIAYIVVLRVIVALTRSR